MDINGSRSDREQHTPPLYSSTGDIDLSYLQYPLQSAQYQPADQQPQYQDPHQQPQYQDPYQQPQYQDPYQLLQHQAPHRQSQYQASHRQSQYQAPHRQSQYQAPQRQLQYQAPQRQSQYQAPQRQSQYQAPHRQLQYQPSPGPSQYRLLQSAQAQYQPPQRNIQLVSRAQSQYQSPQSEQTQYQPPQSAEELQGVEETVDAEASTSTAGAIPKVDDKQEKQKSKKKKKLEPLIYTRPVTLISKRGNSGQNIVLQANYFRLTTMMNWCLYRYKVDFEPEESRVECRKDLFRSHRAKIGACIFDGSVLYTIHFFNKELQFISIRGGDLKQIKMTVRIIDEINTEDTRYIQFFNILLRTCLHALKLELVGRNYFDSHCKLFVHECNLDLWPGYITSIRQHECGILMCAEISHKVMRHDTLLHILNQHRLKNPSNYHESYTEEITGSIVLTGYNNLTYHVETVDFNLSIDSTFMARNNREMSFKEYYATKHHIHIEDDTQPLLVTKTKTKSRITGQQEKIYLIPELCRATGLAQEMKDDARVMQCLARHMRISPIARINKLKSFNSRLLSEPDVLSNFKLWNMCLDNNLIDIPARVLQPEIMTFGRNVQARSINGDWTTEIRNKQLLIPMKLTNWILTCTRRGNQNIEQFLFKLTQVGQGMGFPISRPNIKVLEDDRSSIYLDVLESLLSKQTPQLVFCIVSNNRSEKYSTIKKKCCVDRPVPSQVFLEKNMKAKGLLSILTKVAIQMNCKLGGAPWHPHIPMDGLMVIGFDICRDTNNQGQYYGGLVASMDHRLVKYFSITIANSDEEGLLNDIAESICKAVSRYRECNLVLPERIVIYRDGVSEGQLSYVVQYEINTLKTKLSQIYGQSKLLKMAFIIVTKRINTKLFLNNCNPPSGTIVDDIITNPKRYDFFIISQNVHQGTVTPTLYNVLADTLSLPVDALQQLTYKLTHMYFNCSSTVRVPAPCHYAHKLAFLVAQSVHQLPSTQLETLLYYL